MQFPQPPNSRQVTPLSPRPAKTANMAARPAAQLPVMEEHRIFNRTTNHQQKGKGSDYRRIAQMHATQRQQQRSSAAPTQK